MSKFGKDIDRDSNSTYLHIQRLSSSIFTCGLHYSIPFFEFFHSSCVSNFVLIIPYCQCYPLYPSVSVHRCEFVHLPVSERCLFNYLPVYSESLYLFTLSFSGFCFPTTLPSCLLWVFLFNFLVWMLCILDSLALTFFLCSRWLRFGFPLFDWITVNNPVWTLDYDSCLPLIKCNFFP